jgi:hypothetical protein
MNPLTREWVVKAEEDAGLPLNFAIRVNQPPSEMLSRHWQYVGLFV